MPLKRARKSSSVSEESTSVTDYNDDSLQSASSSISTRKKRKLINSKLDVTHCQGILNKLRNAKADDGHFLTDSFLKLPKKRSASDYYDVVTSPIDLSKIHLKITNSEYQTFLDFEIDIEQLVENAKMYHTSSAIEYQDAMAIWTIYEQEKENIATKLSIKDESGSWWSHSHSGSGSESHSRRSRKRITISVDDVLSDQISLATSDDSRNTSELSTVADNPIEVLFAAVVLQKTDSGRDIIATFTSLPSKHTYPQYYEVIKEPLDLRIIAQKIKNGTYIGVDDLERDFNVMIKNAKTFNQPKSEVYQDALELQKVIKSKRSGHDQGSKPRRKRGQQKVAPGFVVDSFAHMITPKDSDDDGEEPVNELESSVHPDKDLDIGPEDSNRIQQCQLFQAITSVNFNNLSNPSLAFMKLPSKKLYPDYYLEISEPMSLLMVKAKIDRNLYRDVDEMFRDLNLVFNNAKQFNVDGSVIYKDAVRLQNLAHMKRTELTKGSPQDDYMDELLPLVPQSLPAMLPNIFKQYSQDFPRKNIISNSFIKSNTAASSGTFTPRRTKTPISVHEQRVKKINNLFQVIYSHQEDNRFLRDIFMSLPSKELYPKYYDVILNPIDLTIIRRKIDDNKYQTHVDLVDDLKLMFSNAKKFNEETSQIYQDTLLLEKLLKKKLKGIVIPPSGLSRGPKKKTDATKHVVAMSPVLVPAVMQHSYQSRIREIFQVMKEYRDISGRLLSEPFVKLPSKQDMPEYYVYIKKPIEIQTIQYRINNERYQSVEEFMEDLYLMFDNACKFNEPDSQLYRDALILHRVCLEKKSFLTNGDHLSDAPNVQDLVFEIMSAIYSQFMDHTDEDGRYLLDSLREIDGEMITRRQSGQNPNSDVGPSEEHVRLNLDVIKHHLESRRYRRMDRLQEDVFSYLKYVRSISSIQSQAFEDSCQLQRFFIESRDAICERGDVLLTPALNYTERYLNQDIELQTKEKSEIDVGEEDDHQFVENTLRDGSYRMLNSLTRQDNNFQIGDFVRIQKEPGEIPRIGEICAVLVPNTDDIHAEDSNCDGSLIRVNWYYYPQQTIHKSTKRIMEKEIFQTSVYETVSVNKIISKCLIMHVKDHVTHRAKNFKDNDIFVCESKYSVKDNSFKKLKNFVYKNRSIVDNFIEREEPIKLCRRFSTFVSDIVTFDFSDHNFLLENIKKSVPQEDRSVMESCVYYDQYVCDNGFSVKVGDYVYVDDEASRTQIVRIDQLWQNTQENAVYFSGPWFINAMNVDHLPTRMFYRKEVFLSSVEGATHSLTSIIGKCVILSFLEYCKYRPSEYSDGDVFACQYKYFSDEKVTRKLKKGLKKALLSTKALDDEIYFFKKELIPNKEPSCMLSKCSTESIRQEYITRILSLSSGQYTDDEYKSPVIAREDSTCNTSATLSSNQGSTKKPKKPKMRKPPSGYVLYAGEIRKKLLKDNPEAQFGVISKEVGQMWRNIPQSDKDVYERRALEIKQAMEKETAIADEIETQKNESLLKQQSLNQNLSPPMFVANSPIQNQKLFMPSLISSTQQQIPQSPSTFPGTSSIQYFQASNGQVIQFMPSTSTPTNGVQQLPATVTEQPLQPSQPIIYQITSQSQGNQPMTGGLNQLSNCQPMTMPQNKVPQFHTSPMSICSQGQQIPTNISNINYNQMQQNQLYAGYPNQQQTNVIPNVQQNQNLNPAQNSVTTVTTAPQHFISVGTRSARVLHSDIYQRYIDKLRKNSSTLSDWRQQLNLTKESVLAVQGSGRQSYINRLCHDVAPAFLDSKLLVDKEGKKLSQESIVDCLFQLRDHMLQDAMNIRTRILGLGEL